MDAIFLISNLPYKENHFFHSIDHYESIRRLIIFEGKTLGFVFVWDCYGRILKKKVFEVLGPHLLFELYIIMKILSSGIFKL